MGYTKYHDPWGANNSVSAKALNSIESQWDYIKSDADSHSHDSRYYTKATADTTFFSLSYFNNFNADLLDGQHFTDLVANVMPVGSIMIWSGSDADIPDHWQICDGAVYGAYTTPDLRDRFVPCAGSTYAVNATGGPATYNGTIAPTGAVSVGAHTLTTAELPVHTHTYSEYYNISNQVYTVSPPNYFATATRTSSIANQNEGGGGSHGHAGSTAAFTAIDSRPRYYALYYIMKVD
jgi:hypothetical protein